MKNLKTSLPLAMALLAAGLTPSVASAQLRDTLLDPRKMEAPLVAPANCASKVRLVRDTTFETVRTSAVNYFGPGTPGGLGGFDPVPVLSNTVTLTGGCLNAHLSAMVGGTLYGVSKITLFQVTLTNTLTGAKVVMDGHYPTCFGAGPCVALSAEYDVDMLGANFYKTVGSAPGQVPPGTYQVDAWWAGGPSFLGGAGAIGAAFVLKLYQT